jgi:serine/threonine protein kinase
MNRYDMTKSKKFFHNLINPFKFNSNKGGEVEDLEKIAAKEQKHFPFQTLVSATRDFHPANKLGQGGFGPVYKGKLEDGREIAVKRLAHNSNQGKKEFLNEAKLLSRVQHRNVVSLFGFCVHGTEKLLVYEFVANQSLDKLLFKSQRRDSLDWKKRFDTISGVAKGLLYLHEDCHCPIIHRDIKASNILLDNKWVPKIADFGMARLYPEDQTHVNTRVAGTNGYMAPEYVMHGNLSVKADVFSFGVVVLELVSGQKNSSFNLDPDSHNMLEWVYKLYKKGKSLEVMDTVLVDSADPNQIAMCVQIGLLCTQSDPHLRPDMRRVVVMLSKKTGIPEEPTRPGYPGSRYRRTRMPNTSSSSNMVGTSRETNSRSFSSGTGSNSASNTTATTSTITTPRPRPRPDPHGKRPIIEE